MKVRLFHDTCTSLTESLAASEACMKLAQAPMLAWRKPFDPKLSPIISIGHFQSWQDVPDGRNFVRRRSGGNLVYHDKLFLIGLLIPSDHPLYQQDNLTTLSQIVATTRQGLRMAGLEVSQVAEEDATSDHRREAVGACYDQRFRFDLFAGDRKCAGFTYNKSREALLHHISLQFPTDTNQETVLQALLESLTPLLGTSAQETDLTEAEQKLTGELLENRYKTDAWNKAR